LESENSETLCSPITASRRAGEKYSNTEVVSSKMKHLMQVAIDGVRRAQGIANVELLLLFGEFRMCGSQFAVRLEKTTNVLCCFRESVLEPFPVDLDCDGADFHLHVCTERCKDIASQAGQQKDFHRQEQKTVRGGESRKED
jgi:hypothetical protein